MSHVHDQNPPIPPTWWDSTLPDSFFQQVYRRGDHSREGHLREVELDVPARTMRECNLVEATARPRAGARILDCPCGYGRHSLELASRGYDVVGVDLYRDFVQEARGEASRRQLLCRFMEGDMRSIPLPSEAFDLAINMFFSFGFMTDEGNQRTLNEFARVLRPGGVLLIHTDVNPDAIASDRFHDRSIRHLERGAVLRVEERYDESSCRLNGRWTISEDSGREIASDYSVRIYSDAELRRMATSSGFKEMNRATSSTERPCGEIAQEVIYVLRR